MGRGKHIPLRRCVVCGRQGAKGELLRVVRTASGEAQVDPSTASGQAPPTRTRQAPGRGAYVCREGACREALDAALGPRGGASPGARAGRAAWRKLAHALRIGER